MGMFDLGSNVVVEEDQDTLGGGGVQESGLYDCTIKLAYITKSAGGAMAINLVLETDRKVSINQQIYISSGDAKGNKFTYTDKKSGEEKPLPGYSQINSLCQSAIGKQLKDLDPEEKILNLYDYNAKKEIPTKVPVITELLNAPITVGLLKQTEDKRAKDATGNYVATGETRDINVISKVFRTEGRLTNAEIAAGATTGEFAKKWLEKNKGVVVDKSTKVANAPQTGLPTPNPTTPTKSMFN